MKKFLLIVSVLIINTLETKGLFSFNTLYDTTVHFLNYGKVRESSFDSLCHVPICREELNLCINKLKQSVEEYKTDKKESLFSKLFRKKTRMSPLDYEFLRRKLKEMEEISNLLNSEKYKDSLSNVSYQELEQIKFKRPVVKLKTYCIYSCGETYLIKPTSKC